MGIFGKIKKKLLRFSGRMYEYQEAITFAEAGEFEHALKVLGSEQKTVGTAKLLVVGNEASFTEEMIEYAIDMAKRMSYEILALNAAPFSCETFKMFSATRIQLCKDFEDLSTISANVFREEAKKEGVKFSHVIKFDEMDKSIESVCKEVGNITFVVSESHEQLDKRGKQEERLQQKLFVYTMASR